MCEATGRGEQETARGAARERALAMSKLWGTKWPHSGRARPSRREKGRCRGTVAPGGRPGRARPGQGRRCAGPGARDSTPRPDTHHERGPRSTARAPAAPTAERGSERASSRSPPPPRPRQIHMGRGPDQGAPTFTTAPPASEAHGLTQRPKIQAQMPPLPTP